ncbi:MAG: cell envelope integrity protein CreD [Pseudomonadota bacterium]
MTFVESMRRALNSPAFKFIIVVILTLALTIPLLFVYGLLYERESYSKAAQREIGEMWGGPKTIAGPFLVVPTERRIEHRSASTTPGADQSVSVRTEIRRWYAVFLPETLTIAPDIRSEVRRRGIFEVPVYRAKIRISGSFVVPEQRRIAQTVDRILWSEAVLVSLISDVRGIKSTAEIKIGVGPARKFRAGVGLGGLDTRGIHVPIPEEAATGGFTFSYDLELNGSTAFNVTPAGGDTVVTMTSDWPHPSFAGSFLPESRSISDAGFEARWAIPRLARGQGQVRHVQQLRPLATEMQFGVQFFQPVRFYSLAQRALKYALGFIAIAFFAVFIMEIQSRTRVHWIQYIFTGLALVIFYVLLIGTSEHIGFDRGYLSASVATSVLIGIYFGSVVRSVGRGLAMFTVLALIYGLLYLLLRLEDYALLVGSIAAFVLIATVMFATRNVDWSTGAAPTLGGSKPSDA